MNNLTHEAVILQERKLLRYRTRPTYHDFSILEVAPRHEDDSSVELWEGTLDAPIMCKEDDFYIEELDKSVRIKRVERSSHNKYRYFIYERDIVEDEETEVSKEEARALVVEHNEKVRAFRKERRQQTLEEHSRNRTWVERLRELLCGRK